MATEDVKLSSFKTITIIATRNKFKVEAKRKRDDFVD
jgi:hypothetical protein